jgi:hypothetical protein
MANNPKQDEEFSFHDQKMTHKKGEGGVWGGRGRGRKEVGNHDMISWVRKEPVTIYTCAMYTEDFYFYFFIFV